MKRILVAIFLCAIPAVAVAFFGGSSGGGKKLPTGCSDSQIPVYSASTLSWSCGDPGAAAMVYPGAGVSVSTGSAWTTSLSATNLGAFAAINPSANVKSMLGAANYAEIKTLLGYYTSGDAIAGTFTGGLTGDVTGNVSGYAASLKSPATTGLAQLTGMGTGTTRVKTVRDANDTVLELGGSYTPTGTWDWSSATATWPTLGAVSATSVNKVALTAPATGSTITIADGKTLTASNTLTLAGTDSTTMTFPGTSASIARTDAAQTFTGNQTFSGHLVVEGVTSTGASGTGKFVFDTSPTLVTPVLGAATGTSLALGADPADTGAIRLPNAGYIYSEANAPGTDISVIGVDAFEVVQIGASGAFGVTITPAITNTALTANRAVFSNANKVLTPSATTAAELGYLNGVTSAVQTQLNAKQASHAALTSISGLTETAGGLPYATADNTYTNLAVGSVGQILRSTGTAPAWTTVTIPSTVAAGSVLVANSANAMSALTSTSGTYFLQNANGTLSWASDVGTVTIEGVEITRTIAHGSATFNPGSIANGACSDAVDGGTATGVATTDVINWGFSGTPVGVTGYNPSGDLGYIVAYPTADHVNFSFCNKSGSAIDPGSVTLNWQVQR